MSKIGKKPIIISEGVEAKIDGGVLNIKGKKGELSLKILPFVKIDLNDKAITFSVEGDFKQARSNWGTMRALANNAVIGVNDGFSKALEIGGVGYRALLEGNNLVLNIGFTNPVKIIPPAGIAITVDKNVIKVSGIDKALVGKTAAEIRAKKKPEPYKGKGIKYQGEVIKRKEGKKAAAAAK